MVKKFVFQCLDKQFGEIAWHVFSSRENTSELFRQVLGPADNDDALLLRDCFGSPSVRVHRDLRAARDDQICFASTADFRGTPPSLFLLNLLTSTRLLLFLPTSNLEDRLQVPQGRASDAMRLKQSTPYTLPKSCLAQ